MRLRLDKKNVGRILEALYLLILAALIAWSFLNTTKFEITWPEYLYSDLKAILLLIIILKAGYRGNYNKMDILLIFIIGSTIMLNVSRNGYVELEILLLLIIGAKDIDFQKIVRIYFIITAVLLFYNNYCCSFWENREPGVSTRRQKEQNGLGNRISY